MNAFLSATLLVAVNELRRSARAKGMPFYKYGMYFSCPILFFFFFFFNVHMVFREIERERDRVQVGEEQRERETQNRKEAPGSELSAQSLAWGSNS